MIKEGISPLAIFEKNATIGLMKFENFTLRWHSRAGQGAVTAANFMGEALADLQYKTISFPDYGAEKRGAHVVVYNRFSESSAEEFLDPAHPRKIDLVVLMDPSLVGVEIDHEAVLKGLKKDGILLINTEKTDASGFNKLFSGTIVHVPATKIAQETVGRNVPNVPMAGALTKILDLPADKMANLLGDHLEKFFKGELVEKNLVGFHRGQNELTTFTP